LTDKASNSYSDFSLALIAGTLVTFAWVCLTWRYGFDFADEGFYWYGAQRAMHGEVPMRDFMAYDIGRYFWSAAIMRILGNDGLSVARLGAAIYQSLAIVIGVLLSLRTIDVESVVCGPRRPYSKRMGSSIL
jgi:uncharacterized membrane protein YbhN (UPF0104 family)